MNLNHIDHGASHAPIVPEGMDPRMWRKSIERQLEEMLDRQFELVTLLDLMDADAGIDPDMEAAGDEQDCSWPEGLKPFGGAHEDDEDSDIGEDDGCAEPTLGAPESCAYSSPSAFITQVPGSHLVRYPAGNQLQWGRGSNRPSADDCEVENEHGGDVQDEPHDEADEGNREYSLCYGIMGGRLDEEDGPYGYREDSGGAGAVAEGRALLAKAYAPGGRQAARS